MYNIRAFTNLKQIAKMYKYSRILYIPHKRIIMLYSPRGESVSADCGMSIVMNLCSGKTDKSDYNNVTELPRTARRGIYFLLLTVSNSVITCIELRVRPASTTA